MWKDILYEPVKALFLQAGNFISSLCLVILVILIGWLAAKFVKDIVLRIMDIVQLDNHMERVGVDKILAKGGIKYSVAELIAVLCYWLVMLISLIVAVNMVNVQTDMLDAIVLYIPKVISGVVVLLLGIFFAAFINSVVVTAVANAGIEQANLLGKLSQWTVVIFAVLISLEQLGIGTQIISLTVTIFLASIGLAIALAFGLGCKEIAAKGLQDIFDKLKTSKK